MPAVNPRRRLTLMTAENNSRSPRLAVEVAAGLTASPKQLPCHFFYDRQGSLFFEEICELPEYYLTRAEREILQRHAAEIVDLFSSELLLVELGSGSAAKTRLLIEAILRRQARLRYLTVDISLEMLEESSLALLKEYPGLEVTAVADEYHSGLGRLQKEESDVKLILWLGSNVGNFHRPEAAAFLRRVLDRMSARDRLLMGIDLRKDRHVLESAYDDGSGVTARFNLNILARINRELGGHFDLEAFRHRAVYNEAAGRIEMYLVSARAQRVSIDALALPVDFRAEEAIHTENSYKYSLSEIEALAAAAGFHIAGQWFDDAGRFSLNLLAPAG